MLIIQDLDEYIKTTFLSYCKPFCRKTSKNSLIASKLSSNKRKLAHLKIVFRIEMEPLIVYLKKSKS